MSVIFVTRTGRSEPSRGLEAGESPTAGDSAAVAPSRHAAVARPATRSDAEAVAVNADARAGESLLAIASSAKGATQAETRARPAPPRDSSAAAQVSRDVQNRRLNNAVNAATRMPIVGSGSTGRRGAMSSRQGRAG